MPISLHNHWRDFKASAPGHRFQDVYQRHVHDGGNSSGMRHFLLICSGLLLTVIGMLLLPAPGPGSLVLLLGVVLIARESLLVARLLDRLELFIRTGLLRVRRWWKRS